MHLSKAAGLLVVMMAAPVVSGQFSSIPFEHFWVTDGHIRTVSEHDGILYAGGTFQYAGKRTGGLAIADANTGRVNATLPRVDGVVNAIVSDGSGGWLIGGAFTNVGGFLKTNLARLNADLTVSPVTFPITNGSVHALSLVGQELAVGGNFRIPSGTNLTLLDISTGIPSEWQPWAAPQAQVKALASHDGKIYTLTANDLAVIDSAARTRRRLPSIFFFNADPILTMTVSGNILYFGGTFTALQGGTSHGPAAALDLTSETIVNWDPFPTQRSLTTVNDITASNGIVYIAAEHRMDANPIPSVTFGSVGAYDAITGQAIWTNAFNTAFQTGKARSLALRADRLFVGGDFWTADELPRRRTAMLNPATGEVLDWTCHTDGSVNALALSADGERLVMGGAFSSAGGVARGNLAAFELASGAATDWNPETPAGARVLAIEAAEQGVVIGGSFHRLNGAEMAHLGVVDRWIGTNLNFNARLPLMAGSLRSGVFALAREGAEVFFGGGFTNSFGMDQKFIAGFNLDTLQPGNFRPSVDSGVRQLAVKDGVVYAGGWFLKAGATARPLLAAFDSATGALESWNPQIELPQSGEPAVGSMAKHGNTLYFAGSSLSADGKSRVGGAAVDLATAAATDWMFPPELGIVTPMLPLENVVYMISGRSVLSYDAQTGARLPWEAALPGLAYDLHEVSGALVAAGEKGLTLFPQTPRIQALASGFKVAPFPMMNVAIDGSADLIHWSPVLRTNSTLGTFVIPTLDSNENRFYRITESVP